MPSTARILKFRARQSPCELRPQEVAETARAYMDQAADQRTDQLRSEVLVNPDVFIAVLRLLREEVETSPLAVAEEASRIHAWLKAAPFAFGLFDERDYFLGETAFMTGNCLRVVGKRDEASRWLDRAESSFRLIVNSAPSLSTVAYARL